MRHGKVLRRLVPEGRRSDLNRLGTDMIRAISDMHSCFLRYAGKQCTAKRCSEIYHQRTWYQLINAGFTTADVELYLSWIHYKNMGRKDKYKRTFNIAYMFGDVQRFEAEFNEAKAWHRNQIKPTAKERALRELRPVVEESVTTAPIESIGVVVSRVMSKIKTSQPQGDERRIVRERSTKEKD